ncbi:(R)-mandelonitrile beta-glucosyltransferase-like [Argentina anserina]|uniref:(R)-mandelonitrile beta-glucosyltransferase-like n=1 Tax=Argentina anserina TaxID=57926 RepID=UPI0021763EA7|nr:(R)-mandelonitrile beta-glucosyltransferase-like [Potentilla anserina]
METEIDSLPALIRIRLRDIPSFIRTTYPEDGMIKTLLIETERVKRASAIILNTFDDIEHEVLDALKNLLPPIYSIGPLHLLLDQHHGLIEFGWGLANSNKTFFWVIRPELVGGESAVVPAEFVEETKERSLLITWCPQEQLLNHPAIGGFLTHSGWNSTLESVCAGVPMICWPFFAEQQTNCRYCCKDWGIGMEIEGDVNRSNIEDLVTKLMDGEEGKDMRKKAMEWKKLAKEAATGPKGLSFLHLNKMVNEVFLSTKLK